MRKKLLCTVAAVAMMTGLFVVGATPALAEDPPASFLPDEDGAGDAIGTVLSDRLDGVDSAAHLTVVTEQGIDRAEWFHCPTSVGDPVTQTELGQCTQMGVDNTPNQPVPGTVFVPSDLAWDITFGVPQDLDNEVLDVLVLGCVGAGTDIEDPGSNCQQTLEEGVTFDDAATGEPDTTTAEIFQFCTADTFGPDGVHGTGDLCDVAGTTQGSDARETIDDRFKDFEHGDPVPNEGFTIRVRTSPDLDFPNLDAKIDFGADASLNPTTVDTASGDCDVIETFSTFKTWQCEFTAGQIIDGAEFALWAEDETGGTGFCAGDPADVTPGFDCVLDSHYHQAVERTAVEAIKSFDPDGGNEPDPPDISPTAGCEDGENRDDEHSTNDLNDFIDEEGCLNDQFQDPFDGDFTVESTGVGGIQSCSGEPHDHDGDGVDEHCHDDTDSNGVEPWTLFNPLAQVGPQNILFCLDEEAFDGTEQSPGPDHGCDDETVTDENVMNWTTEATEVFLAYANTATDPDDPCRTGETFKINQVGDTEDLIVCTFDSSGNPIGTDGPGEGPRMQWFIETTVGGELTGVRFVGQPPSETNQASGEATLQIEAFRESSNFIIVRLFDENGDFVDDFTIEKRVEPRSRARSAVSIRHRGRPHRFVGRVTSPDDSCEPGRRVAVRRQRRGRDPVIGRDTTNNRGRYVVRHNRTNRRFRYYAQVRRNANCRGDTSGRTPRVR